MPDTTLTDAIARVYAEQMPPRLRDSIDRLLAAGETHARILDRVRRAARRGKLTVAMVESYLREKEAASNG